MNLTSIPAFQDNYIWLLSDLNKHGVIVDPGQSHQVLEKLKHQQITPVAILLTHHHYDHVNGVAEIIASYPDITVYGPQETADKGASVIVKGDDDITINNRYFRIIAVPGHTLGHIAYYSAPYLFCGDTLFSAGCGRIFEGTTEQMYQSIQKLAQLPDDTLICCAHEYTLSNIKFAKHILPENRNINTRQRQVIELRAKNQPSVPTTLRLERLINLFLLCDDIDLQKKLRMSIPIKIFAKLRAIKDTF